MREQLYTLLLLQEIDRDVVREKKRQEKLPARIQEVNNAKAKIEKITRDKKESLKELRLKIKRKEIDVKEINTKIEKHQNELYGGKISDIKELKQLQKVIELLKKDRDKIEEGLLVLMDEEDDFKIDLSEAEKELAKLDEQLQRRQKEVNQQDKEIKKIIEEKQKNRTEIVHKINDRELINRYNMLWREKEGEVVVEIDGSTCSGCNLSLPSDIIYHLQRDDMLITCPNCNRILIWKDR